jgi:hypothetical protein
MARHPVGISSKRFSINDPGSKRMLCVKSNPVAEERSMVAWTAKLLLSFVEWTRGFEETSRDASFDSARSQFRAFHSVAK